jgi:fructose-specific component phosphotransferase system IIB-like protein
MKFILLLLFTIFILTSVTKAQHIDALKWLVGNWKIQAGNNVIVEQWQVLNDSTLSGKSVFIKNGTDTIPQETIELAYRNGDWYYMPTVNDQNAGKAVTFKVILLKGTEFIAENPTHDFPQRIAYRKIKNLLFASIEGRKNGKYNKQNYDFTGD